MASALRILQGGDSLVYPAKSYIVALCYAERIAILSGDDFYTVLAYPALLHDDEHFVPYNEESSVVYDTLIPGVLDPSFKTSELFQAINGYINEELGLGV